MNSSLMTGACAVVLLVGSACTLNVGDGPFDKAGDMRRESKSFEKSGAELVQVDLEMGAGELKVKGGSSKLFEGDFAYNVPSFKPEVRYDSTGFRGRLLVKQGAAKVSPGDVENTWDLRFANDVPLDLRVRCGAGESGLELQEMMLRSIEVHMGAGKVEIHLPRKPDRSFDVKVHGGVGEAIIHYPSDAGIQAEAAGGLGEIEVDGLEKDGGKYINQLYGKARANIRMEVKGGIGAIRIKPL